VDAVVGTGEIENILAAVEGQLRIDAGAAAALPSYLYHDLTPRILSTPRHAAYIKIAEGCDHPCTFCIIRSCEENSAAGDLSRWCAKRKAWPAPGSAKLR